MVQATRDHHVIPTHQWLQNVHTVQWLLSHHLDLVDQKDLLLLCCQGCLLVQRTQNHPVDLLVQVALLAQLFLWNQLVQADLLSRCYPLVLVVQSVQSNLRPPEAQQVPLVPLDPMVLWHLNFQLLQLFLVFPAVLLDQKRQAFLDFPVYQAGQMHLSHHEIQEDQRVQLIHLDQAVHCSQVTLLTLVAP